MIPAPDAPHGHRAQVDANGHSPPGTRPSTPLESPRNAAEERSWGKQSNLVAAGVLRPSGDARPKGGLRGVAAARVSLQGTS